MSKTDFLFHFLLTNEHANDYKDIIGRYSTETGQILFVCTIKKLHTYFDET